MIDAKNAVVWVNISTREVMVRPRSWGTPRNNGLSGFWGDPISAFNMEWHEMTDAQRVLLMLETVIDLAMQGSPLEVVLKKFARIRESYALGRES